MQLGGSSLTASITAASKINNENSRTSLIDFDFKDSFIVDRERYENALLLAIDLLFLLLSGALMFLIFLLLMI